jgi:hypothetical protein
MKKQLVLSPLSVLMKVMKKEKKNNNGVITRYGISFFHIATSVTSQK